MTTLVKFIGDWLYAIWISFFPPKEENAPGDDAT